MNNDVAKHLRLIPAWDQACLVHQMLKIQESRESKETPSDWSQDLKLLSLKWPEGRLLEWANLNEHEQVDYLAVSYSWAVSPYEGAAQYNWRLQNDDSRQRSNVRDAILDRVTTFMTHAAVRHLWIDTECIDQRNKEEKRRIMGNMHQVYSNSSHALALLFVPIRTSNELDTLEQLLTGKLVKRAGWRKRDDGDPERYVLAHDLFSDSVLAILDLVHRLLSDAWWSRAWCYQEEYVTISKLKLLFPVLFKVRKPTQRVIEVMEGNISISAANFRRKVTQFIFAYTATASRKTARYVFDRGLCRQILKKAGWYLTMAVHGHALDLENEGKAMSTQILSDISSKGFTVPSDLIHIAANCNLYAFTLNTEDLDKQRSSLAIAMLTIFFLNGEIFWNSLDDNHSEIDSADLNVFQYLKRIAFNEFATIEEAGQLAHLRRYRFVDPVLTANGVQCIGTLWEIDCVLDVNFVPWFSEETVESEEEDSDGVDQVVKFLMAVQECLPNSCSQLSRRIKNFLDNEFDRSFEEKSLVDIDTMSLAAVGLFNRFSDGRFVGLGHICNNQPQDKIIPVKQGLFAVSQQASKQNPVYAFTALQHDAEQQEWYDARIRQAKIVSLDVSVDSNQTAAEIPILRTQASIHSLFFSEDVQQTSVLFPWPPSLPQPRGQGEA